MANMSFPEKKKLVFVLILLVTGGLFTGAAATTTNVFSTGGATSAPTIADVYPVGEGAFLENVGNYDNKFMVTDNIVGGTGGSLDNGNLFAIETENRYVGGFWVRVDLLNREDLNDDFSSLNENIVLYSTNESDNGSWNNADNWTKVESKILAASGDSVEFSISSSQASDYQGLAVGVENGWYYAKEGGTGYGPIQMVAEIDEFS